MISTNTPHTVPSSDNDNNTHRILSLAEFVSRREELGLSLSDVFARTRISIKNLAALEGKDFASLPAPVYTRGFIRQYAKFLNVVPHHALQEYDDYLKNIGNPLVTFEKRKTNALQDIFHAARSSRVLILAAILFIVFFVLLIFLLEKSTTQQTQRSRDAKDRQTMNNSPSFPEGDIETAFQLANTEVLQVNGMLKLVIKAKETTWMAIRIDDQRREQKKTLYAGDTVTFTGKRFGLNIGNAGGVDIFFQESPLPPLGKRGEVVRIVLPPEKQPEKQ